MSQKLKSGIVLLLGFLLVFSFSGCTNKNADGSISISKVTIYSDESKEKIIKALSLEDADYEIEVCYE